MDSKPKSTEMIDIIFNAIAEELDVPIECFTQKGYRKRKYVEARQIAMYMVREVTFMTYKEIVNIFPVSDHTTVLYGVKAIQSMMEYDRRIMDLTSSISAKISLLREEDGSSKQKVYYTIFDGEKSKGLYVSEKAASRFVDLKKKIIPIYL